MFKDVVKPFIKDLAPELDEGEVEERSEILYLMLKDYFTRRLFEKKSTKEKRWKQKK